MNNQIQEAMSDKEFDNDLAVSYDYDAKMTEIRTPCRICDKLCEIAPCSRWVSRNRRSFERGR